MSVARTKAFRLEGWGYRTYGLRIRASMKFRSGARPVDGSRLQIQKHVLSHLPKRMPNHGPFGSAADAAFGMGLMPLRWLSSGCLRQRLRLAPLRALLIRLRCQAKAGIAGQWRLHGLQKAAKSLAGLLFPCVADTTLPRFCKLSSSYS